MLCIVHLIKGWPCIFPKSKHPVSFFFHHLSFLSFTRTLTSHIVAAMSNSFLAIETFHLPASEALSYALSSILFSKQAKQAKERRREIATVP